jgi:hypothetical protein
MLFCPVFRLFLTQQLCNVVRKSTQTEQKYSFFASPESFARTGEAIKNV